MPTCRKDIGEEDEIRLMLTSWWQFQRVEIRVRDSKVLAL